MKPPSNPIKAYALQLDSEETTVFYNQGDCYSKSVEGVDGTFSFQEVEKDTQLWYRCRAFFKSMAEEELKGKNKWQKR